MVKATGIVRKVDELGRIVIPVELRRTLGIEIGDPLEVYVDGSDILLRKYTPGCVFCGSIHQLIGNINHNLICYECAQTIGKMNQVATGRG